MISVSRIVLVCLFAVTLMTDPARAAEPIVVDDGRFVAAFPTRPTRESEMIRTKAGANVMAHTLLSERGNSSFLVMFSDFPAGSFTAGDRDQVYRDIVTSMTEDKVLRRAGEHRLGDVLGREVFLDAEQERLSFRIRIYLVGDRLYHVYYGSDLGMASSQDGADFLDSFRLLR